MSEPTLPRAHGDAVLSANMRTTPEDFVVEEIPGFEPTGAGEHLLLTVEKRGMNTGFAAKHIAQWAGVGEVAIGYAGLKDRHAVTRQRFSVHLPKKVAPDLSTLDFVQGEERLTVVEHTWHAKKLPRGALAGNRFVLTLRAVRGERDAIGQRLAAIAERGVPNYFGEQRFGRDGDNVANARAMFNGRRVRREQRTLLISAARSELFNRVLAQRVQRGCWDTPLDGEVWMLDGSRSVFGPEPFDDALALRLASFDIHPTGPLWGRGEPRTTGEAAQLEAEALSGEEALALRAGLEAEGLKQERRALRLKPAELAWSWREDDVLELAFALPPGTYATVVLAELGLVTSVGRAG
ncbi:tRNA pseudouridine(13) synthase TruD [Lysobacter auxotrophicus]|uniref:tRNA pseudouridine synthase D n=1 Tax=Lysobacter auxotrophicus TaxID=2992573 RepID=A0ABN6UHY5_9GAMM|nr:tRNA pseudouridine(13) synthase TruD [Lysobacter auxotrophicus]BDU15872.1 tRNA pseudouridine(13) synthase TruD [Lysobacter auxotrophicus]